jgi:hypothetical protein
MEAFGDRILLVKFKQNDEHIAIINVYGPTDETGKIPFLNELQDVISNLPPDYLIAVMGDFNLVRCNDLDIIGGEPYQVRFTEAFNKFMCDSDMFDTWRLYHNNQREFTWSRVINSPASWQARRLDYIFTNTRMFHHVVSCDITPFAYTDHRGVELEYCLSHIKKGPSYWKFNQSLLKDWEYVAMITEKINYCKEIFHDMPAQLKWDICKIQIRECSIAFSKRKACAQRNHINILRGRLKELQSKLSSQTGKECDRSVLDEMRNTKLALDIYSLHKACGVKI